MIGEIVSSVVEYTSQELLDNGLLYCDGSIYNNIDYPLLYGKIGVSFGSSGPGTFAVPNYTGKYLKGKVASRNIGNHQASQNKAHIHSVYYKVILGAVGNSHAVIGSSIDKAGDFAGFLISEGGTDVEVSNYQVYYYIKTGDSMLKQLLDNICKVNEDGSYDYSKMFPYLSDNNIVCYSSVDWKYFGGLLHQALDSI